MQTVKKITRIKKSYKDLFFEANSHRDINDVNYVWENANFKALQDLTTEKANLQALFSLLNSNRTLPLTIDSHITCYASGGYGDAGSFINAKGTIFSLNTKVPEEFIKTNAVETKNYKNITVNYKSFPALYFFKKPSKLKYDKPISKLKFDLKKGDIVTLMECDTIQETFTSSKEQDLVLIGKINEAYADGYHNVYDYKLLFDDIDVESHYKTYTDIGGKWLCVNDKKVAHLGNGFGDGTYTMRFSKGKLVR